MELTLNSTGHVQAGRDDVSGSTRWTSEEVVQSHPDAGEHRPSAVEGVALPGGERAIDHLGHPPRTVLSEPDGGRGRDRSPRPTRPGRVWGDSWSVASSGQRQRRHRLGS